MSSLACEHDATVSVGRAELPGAPQAAVPVEYSGARWRQVELQNVVLWVSHILIRHDAADPDPAFHVDDWHTSAPPAKRTRAEAFALACDLRERASRAPTQFGALAAQYSEDVATQALAGSLGGISASQLIFWPAVLDALALTPKGEVSKVIETQYGFHILLRRAPPHEQTVSGAHLVIAHDDAGWIRILGRRKAPARSRGEALALATRLHQMAKRDPAAFPALVAAYSDHRDAEQAGDMGAWSTREPTHYPREVELLAGLAVGEVAPPIDSHVGLEIIQRTPNRPRERLALEEIRLYFDPARPASDARSQEQVWDRAWQLAQELQAAPLRFDELRAEVCCGFSEEWDQGRGSPAVAAALSRLQIGQIMSEPVQTEQSYVIGKRAEPTRKPLNVRFELPEPSVPDSSPLPQGAR